MNKLTSIERFLVYGSLNIDLIFEVDHMVQVGETLASTKLTKSAGGKGANQATGLAKAGLKVKMAGKIGEDGLFLLQHLNNYTVDTHFVQVYNGATGQALIQLDKQGQNCILLYAGGNGLITKEEIIHTLSQFNTHDALVVQNEINNLEFIIQQAKEKGLFIILNPSPIQPNLTPDLLQQVNMLFLNETEAVALSGLSAPVSFEEMLHSLMQSYGNTEIILTTGENGAYYGYKEKIYFEPALKVQVVDTTAAGDTFAAYFIAARKQNFSIEKALQLASVASSLTVSRLGAMESIPLANEIF